MIVELQTVARLCARNGWRVGRLPVTVMLRYSSRDPYAVVLVFSDEDRSKQWVVDRGLLYQGLHSADPVGLSDVHVWRSEPRRSVWLRLSNGPEDCLIEFVYYDVSRFLRRSYALVRAGDESAYLDVDACIEALLDGAR